MTYTILIGGAAGQGIDTTAAIFELLIKKAGYEVLTSRDFMSRIRGGHNFIVLRFGNEPITSCSMRLDGLVALDDDTVMLHQDELKKDGFILCDEHIKTEDERVIRVAMNDMAKELGNPRVSGSIAVGVLMALFDLSLENAEIVLKSQIKQAYLDINIKAMNQGYDLTEPRYDCAVGNAADKMLISGNKAVALGALAAGLKFYSAYPMSPSTGIMEYLADVAKDFNLVVEQAEDEIAAINMAIGASYTGAVAMTGTSGGGFALMVEALGLAGIAEIPVVICDVQRPGPATGLPTRTEQSDLKFVISAAQGEFPRIVISVRDQADAYYQTIRAFRLAQTYQVPVILLSDQYIADGSASVERFKLPQPDDIAETAAVDQVQTPYMRYRYTEDGLSPRLFPGMSKHLVTSDSDEHDEQGFITESADVRNQMMKKRMGKMDLIKGELEEPTFIGSEDFETLLLGWGSTAGAIREAVTSMNQKGAAYAALIFGDVYPLPEKTLMEKAGQAKQIINVEQNYTGQLAGVIREYTGLTCDKSLLKYDGRQILAEEIVAWLQKEVQA